MHPSFEIVSRFETLDAAQPRAARVRLEIIASAGHVPCLERPAATTHALSDFLATLA